MHSLSFKVLGDFKAGSRMNLPGRGSFCFPEMEVGATRCFGGRLAFRRTCRIVACDSERNGDGGGRQSQSPSTSRSRSFLSRSETYALLKQQLEVAAKSEAISGLDAVLQSELVIRSGGREIGGRDIHSFLHFPMIYGLERVRVSCYMRPRVPCFVRLDTPNTNTHANYGRVVEDYEEAARIRDSLKLFEEEEPVLRLRRLMKEAISNERFEDAAKYRDELNEIAPHCLLKCASDATTLGIRVQVRSVYIEGRSQPSKNQYFFAYRIRITNNSNRPIQLLRRHWIITDANGKTENVWGVGVIGEQPVILPSTGFEYSSACPLSTANGRMEGDFEMKYIDRVGEQSFNVAIAPFSLSILGDTTDAF